MKKILSLLLLAASTSLAAPVFFTVTATAPGGLESDYCNEVCTSVSPGGTKVRLTWTASPSADVTGYRVYVGATSRGYTRFFDVTGTTCELTVAADDIVEVTWSGSVVWTGTNPPGNPQLFRVVSGRLQTSTSFSGWTDLGPVPALAPGRDPVLAVRRRTVLR